MSGFAGWWINGKTGKGVHVAEHWMEVRSNPEHYGLSEDEVKDILNKAGGAFNPGDTSPDGARGMLLQAAMKNGWVRVRGYQGRYSIQGCGHLATYLPKVFNFLKGAGVGRYSEMMIYDLASNFTKRYVDGMTEAIKDLKAGRIPDVAPKGHDEPETAATAKERDGIDMSLSDVQKRTMMRQRLGQKIHLPDPSPDDNKLPESRRDPLGKGLKRLFG